MSQKRDMGTRSFHLRGIGSFTGLRSASFGMTQLLPGCLCFPTLESKVIQGWGTHGHAAYATTGPSTLLEMTVIKEDMGDYLGTVSSSWAVTTVPW